MSPRAIAEQSRNKGLDIIAVCDHNSAENAASVIRACSTRGVHVLPGLEINSREEVHTLAIFDSQKQAHAMQEVVYRHLNGTNRPELFGEQVVANEFDEVEGFNDRRLIGATQLGLNDVINEVHLLGGLSIASHVDRPSFSIVSQLGFISPDMELDALEIAGRGNAPLIENMMPHEKRFPLVTFSDAHVLCDIGRATTMFYLDRPCVCELLLALRGLSGRKIGK